MSFIKVIIAMVLFVKHPNRMFSLKNEKVQAKKHTTSGHQWPASDMPSQWPIAGGSLMARRCVLAGMKTL